MFTFLHTADWQIGKQFGQFDGDYAALMAQARLDVVARIAALATERRVDAVLVAGDVFDMQGVSDRTIRKLFTQLEGFSGDWVLIAGNHDAALAESVWTRAAALGCIAGNVHIPASTEIVRLAGADILAAPLTQRHTYGDVTDLFDTMTGDGSRIRVGLAHGSVTGRLPEGIDSANPIAPDRAVRAQLDYLALGDWHGCLSIDARTWYAGTPETDRFRNNESGMVLHATIAAPGATPVVERVAVGRYRWQSIDHPIVVPADIEALDHRLQSLTEQDLVRLTVSGTLSLADWDALQDVVARA